MYLENIFPMYNIRYIAINDNYDSLKEENDFGPFKNIINEWYAKDISKKIRSTLTSQARLGLAKKTMVPIYGYMYNEKNERIIDPVTRGNVETIFNEYITTSSITKVIEKLQKEKIYTPGYYNYLKYNYNTAKYACLKNQDDKYLWDKTTIRSILRKREYLGDYVTCQTYSKSYKNKTRYKTKQPFVFTKRYEGIVNEATFYEANNILNQIKDAKSLPKNKYRSLISCNNCHKNLTYKKEKNGKHRYYCNNKNCTKRVSIYLDTLDLLIERELEKLKCLLMSKIDTIIKTVTIKKPDDNLQTIAALNNRINDVNKYIKLLFVARSKNKIDENTFDEVLTDYNTEITETKEKIRSLENKEVKQIQLDGFKEWINCNIKTINITKIFSSITVKTISKVKNKTNKEITFTYRKLDQVLVK